jgi:antitoxin MazE
MAYPERQDLEGDASTPSSLRVDVAGSSSSVYSYNMLSKKLIPVGNSLGLVIDKPILDMLSISKDTELEIRTEGNALIIMPVRKDKEHERERSFRDALQWVIEHHGETLQKLSK